MEEEEDGRAEAKPEDEAETEETREEGMAQGEGTRGSLRVVFEEVSPAGAFQLVCLRFLPGLGMRQFIVWLMIEPVLLSWLTPQTSSLVCPTIANALRGTRAQNRIFVDCSCFV